MNWNRNGIILIASTFLIGIQLYRPHKNIQRNISGDDFLNHEEAPLKIRKLYINACYDCHSYYTNYEWFDDIAPISWYVDENIKRAIFALNFSEWKHLSSKQKEIMFSAIPFNIQTGRMPEQQYELLHSRTKLSEYDRIIMIQWLQQVKIKFLKEHN